MLHDEGGSLRDPKTYRRMGEAGVAVNRTVRDGPDIANFREGGCVLNGESKCFALEDCINRGGNTLPEANVLVDIAVNDPVGVVEPLSIPIVRLRLALQRRGSQGEEQNEPTERADTVEPRAAPRRQASWQKVGQVHWMMVVVHDRRWIHAS